MQVDKTSGLLSTLIFHGALLCVLLYFGYQKPWPPPPEQGILINFGDSPTGDGTEEPMAGGEFISKPMPPRPQQAIPEQAEREDYEVVSQNTEDVSVALSKPKKRKKTPKPTRVETKKPVKPQPQQPQVTNEPAQEPQSASAQVQQNAQPVEKPRSVNRNALFPGAGSGTSGQGSPTSTGQGTGGGPGNQGALDGSPYSPNTVGSGLGDISGTRLDGRSLVGKLPEPDYRVQQSGKVIVRIKVDRDGAVVEAKADPKGSTVMDATLYDAAERAARRAKFSGSATGPIYQNGIIIYVFKLGQ